MYFVYSTKFNANLLSCSCSPTTDAAIACFLFCRPYFSSHYSYGTYGRALQHLFFATGPVYRILAPVIHAELGLVVNYGLVPTGQQITTAVAEQFQVSERIANFAGLQASVVDFSGTDGGIGLMIPDASNVQFGDGVKG
mmetsp:Transcript_5610/g.12235  ORF Transcript_5610/g.12235 Transcript_5610/m.12235 type:complete len:139 (-) Transcript_5610:1487-1903(-)